MTATSEILTVDLDRFESGHHTSGDAVEVAEVTMRSLTKLTTGFVFVEHGLNEDFLDDVYGVLAEFFAQPSEFKSQFSAAASAGAGGYTELGVETAAGATTADHKEMFNWTTRLPENHPLRAKYPKTYAPAKFPPGTEEVLTAFHNQVEALQRRVLRVVALGLGAHVDFFEDIVVNGATLSRALHYPAPPADAPEDLVWAGAHTDINLITALPRATSKGLQMKTSSGDWIDAVAPDGHAIINTGMMLERLSNGVITAGEHRVVADPDQPTDRYSIVQFCHPKPTALLSPMPSCVSQENPLRFGTVSAHDRLQEVLYDIALL